MKTTMSPAAGRLRAGKAGEPVAAADRDHLGARAARAFRRAVAAAAVDHDDPVDDVARQFGDDGADRFRFVEGRNDDGNAAGVRRHGYRLHRNPQLAQASGGLFDLSALRKPL